MALREVYKEIFAKQHNVRLGFMPFFVKSCVAAMKALPEVNAYIDGEDIIYRNYFDIGIAVGTDKGVMVPVVRECDKLSFAGIEKMIEQHAKKAKEGSISTNDLQGGSFTITNGGVYGSLLSTPIINPPQSAILGMHKIMKRPVVVDDQIVIRQMMYLALSYDHRLIDGKEAVSFLVHIKNSLEDPSRLLLDIF
jgi:2-oxoglutarate dehydrogenase E2 component (dihydrolipoamide succinyltransferase)